MQGNIQAFALLLLGDAEPNGHIDDLQNDITRRESINDGHGDAFQLNEHGAIQTADLLAGEYAGEQRADDAADSVHRSEEHTSELQSHLNLVCRLLLEKTKTHTRITGYRRSRPYDANSHSH